MTIYVTEKYCGFMYSGSRTLIYKYNANELVVIFFLKSMQVSSLHIFTLFFPISPFLPIAHQTQEEKKNKQKLLHSCDGNGTKFPWRDISQKTLF